MSKIDIILPRLAGVRKAPCRAGVVQSYRACCPVHQPEGPKPGRSPSLSVAESVSGGVLLTCHAGCTFNEITDAAGVDPAELMPDSSSSGSGIPGGPAGWASVAALLDAAGDAVANAAAGGDWWKALAAVDAAKRAARLAMRKGVAA